MNNSTYAITTPIYYVNDRPHLGTAYTTVAADCVARYQRMKGMDVAFVTGMDEHGQKVAQTADQNSMKPLQWCDHMEPYFREEWKKLNITYTDFVRTTEPRQHRSVQKFWQILFDNNFLYKDTYEGWYCVHEEAHYAQSDLNKNEDGIYVCPECNRPVKEYKGEENWFFKLSEFQDKLLDYYEKHPSFIRPEIRKNEVISFVRSGLKDLSISRSTFDWGVTLPFDKGHVAYVWADALLAYLTGIGYADPDREQDFEKYWPMQYHFVGKDIIRFHCVIWPAMLMAAGLPLPKCVFGHGFLLTKGEKMSKSRGNAIKPQDLINIFGVDAYRYYFMSDVQFGMDGSISLERMIQVYNSDLANTWGNLCSRVFNMTKKYFDCIVPAKNSDDNPLKEIVDSLFVKFDNSMQNVDFTSAIKDVMALAQSANLYIEQTSPWVLAKNDDYDSLSKVIYNLLETIRIIAIYLSPFMPTSSSQVLECFDLDGIKNINDLTSATKWGQLAPDISLSMCKPLFPRLKESEISIK